MIHFIFHWFSYVHLWCLLIGVANRTGQASWCCAVRPASLVLLFDGIYCPKMKGANWLKLMCSQGKSQVNIFSLWNIWYKSVVPSLIWLHSSVCQIHNKQMSKLVAYSSNICVWVVSCNECGGWQLGPHSAMVPVATFMKESRSSVLGSQQGRCVGD